MDHVVEVHSRGELLAYLRQHYDFWELISVAGKAALFSDGPLPETD